MMPTEQWVTNEIKAMKTQVGKLTDELLNTKFQHAEIAAKVEGLRTDLSHVHEMSSRQIELISEQITRIQVNNKITCESLNLTDMLLDQRIAALESPAPAPDEVRCYDEEGLRVPCDPLPTADPVCGEDCDGSCQKCEDRMFERIYGGGDELPACSRCGGTLIENNCISRECTAYVPEQTAQDKDRRSALIRLMNMLTLNQVNALGEDDMVLIFGKVGEIHIDEHLRAYGKPGANPKMIVPEKRITFVPAAEPAPLDPVLVERAEAMYICWMGEPWPRPALSGADEFNDLPQGSRVRWIRLAEAYGRDGAR